MMQYCLCGNSSLYAFLGRWMSLCVDMVYVLNNKRDQTFIPCGIDHNVFLIEHQSVTGSWQIL